MVLSDINSLQDMTEKEIREHAVKHSQQHCSGYIDDSIVHSYITGAHLLDEEISELKNEVESLQEQYDTLFDGFKKRGKKLGELMKENVKLKTPWISVSDRLPDEDDPNKEGYTVEVIGMADIADFEQCAWHRRIYNCRLDKRDNVWVYGDRDVICDKPDYWIPVPNIPEKKI